MFGRDDIARVADRLMGGLDEQRTLFRPAPVQAQDDRARLRITPRHLSYLKVSEGCDRFCTFCAIPTFRGKQRSRTIESIEAEVRSLVAGGVAEIVLVAQDLAHYGRDVRFEVVYHLRSMTTGERLRVKAELADPEDGSEPWIATVCPLWKCANWMEREVFDMFGIKFTDHPDLRRILMYEEFIGYPLRKDYPKEKRQPLVRRQMGKAD